MNCPFCEDGIDHYAHQLDVDVFESEVCRWCDGAGQLNDEQQMAVRRELEIQQAFRLRNDPVHTSYRCVCKPMVFKTQTSP